MSKKAVEISEWLMRSRGTCRLDRIAGNKMSHVLKLFSMGFYQVVQHTSEKAAEISERLVEIAQHLQAAAPKAYLVLVGLLPRGDRGAEAPAVKYLYPSK